MIQPLHAIGCWRWGLLALGVLGCAVPGSYTCESDSECGDGQCVAGGCAFSADECPSGLRYGKFAPPSLAGKCVEQGSSVADDSGTGSASGSETGRATLTSSESGTGSETGIATETGTDSTDTGTETGTDTDVDPAVPIAHYTFDDIAAPVIVDDTGNGFDAEMDFLQNTVAGVSGMGLSFDGADRVIVPAAVLVGRDAFTVEFYMSTDTPGPMRHWLFYYGDMQALANPPTLGLRVQYSELPVEVGNLRWTDGGGMLTSLYGSASLADMQWHHVAVTVDGTGLRLYVDHQLEVGDPLVPDLLHPQLEWILIGGIPELNDGFRGAVDELRFSEGALVPAQMLPLP